MGCHFTFTTLEKTKIHQMLKGMGYSGHFHPLHVDTETGTTTLENILALLSIAENIYTL